MLSNKSFEFLKFVDPIRAESLRYLLDKNDTGKYDDF